jgi:hypothetical protein
MEFDVGVLRCGDQQVEGLDVADPFALLNTSTLRASLIASSSNQYATPITAAAIHEAALNNQLPVLRCLSSYVETGPRSRIRHLGQGCGA